jgi:hypothetical protein
MTLLYIKGTCFLLPLTLTFYFLFVFVRSVDTIHNNNVMVTAIACKLLSIHASVAVDTCKAVEIILDNVAW